MPAPIVEAAVIVAVPTLLVAAAIVWSRIDVWRERDRRARILADAIERHAQSQHFWRPSPPDSDKTR
jgi:hypothetical protein